MSSPSPRPIEIRSLTDPSDLAEAVRLQREIWGFDEIELVPVRLFVVATKVGGQVFGAFDGAQMIGFLLAIPGLKPGGRMYLHSQMMGVLPEYRDRGVGRMLKYQQRDDALARSIPLIEWTFDPLELRNAYFNIERLGAVIRRYVLNQYGTTSSHLHGGLPTDRCTAEWHISLPRPEAEIVAEVAIPSHIGELRKSDPAAARAVQERVSETFLRHFDEGLTVVRFDRRATEGAYLFGRWHSE